MNIYLVTLWIRQIFTGTGSEGCVGERRADKLATTDNDVTIMKRSPEGAGCV